MADDETEILNAAHDRYRAELAEFLVVYRQDQAEFLKTVGMRGVTDDAPWREAITKSIAVIEDVEDGLALCLLALSGQFKGDGPVPHEGFDAYATKAAGTWFVVAPATEPGKRRFFALIPEPQ